MLGRRQYKVSYREKKKMTSTKWETRDAEKKKFFTVRI